MQKPVGFRSKGKGRKRQVYPIYRGYKGNPRGGGMHVASVIEANQLRTARAQAMDTQRKAPIAQSEEQWLSEPNRYDWQNVDTPGIVTHEPAQSTQVKPFWRKREAIGNMSDEELETYKSRLDPFYGRFSYRSRVNPNVEKVVLEREQVIEEINKRENDKRTRIYHLAAQDHLTLDDTPDKNPYEYKTGFHGQYREDINKEHNMVSPYVEAKEQTEEVANIIDGYDGVKDKNKIFRDYVEYYKKPYGERDEDPYQEVKQVKYDSEEIEDKVKNLVETKGRATGEVDELDVLGHYDNKATKVALKKLQEKESWQRKGNKIILEQPNKMDKPDTTGLQILDRLGAFPRKNKESSEAILVELNANGKAKAKFMDVSRVSMFDGEVDLSKLPGIEGHSGERIIRLEGGDEIALSHPSIGYTNKHGDIVLKKHDAKTTRTLPEEYEYKQENGDYKKVITRERQVVESRVTKEFKVNIHPIDQTAKKYHEELPSPKLSLPQEFVITGRTLAEVTKPTKKTSKDKYARDYEDFVKFYAKNGKTTIVRPAIRENEEDNKKRHQFIQPETLRAEGKARSHYSSEYLHDLANSVEPNDKIKVQWSQDMPLKAEINSKNVKGDWFLAPRIPTED